MGSDENRLIHRCTDWREKLPADFFLALQFCKNLFRFHFGANTELEIFAATRHCSISKNRRFWPATGCHTFLVELTPPHPTQNKPSSHFGLKPYWTERNEGLSDTAAAKNIKCLSHEGHGPKIRSGKMNSVSFKNIWNFSKGGHHKTRRSWLFFYSWRHFQSLSVSH